MVQEYGEPYLASNSEVYSKINWIKNFTQSESESQPISLARLAWLSLRVLRSKSGKEEFRFSEENEHFSTGQ